MTDLTVLVSPTALYPNSSLAAGFGFSFAHKSETNLVSRKPVMVTLQPSSASASSTSFPTDHSLLSPPDNTWKARSRRTRSLSAPPHPSALYGDPQNQAHNENIEPRRRPITPPPRSFFRDRLGTTKGGELIRPPPPLLRPTTFWRKNKRSGVSGASYSPSSHLIRRSTFIAAGLTFDAPIADLSAFCVESRVGFILLPPDQELQ